MFLCLISNVLVLQSCQKSIQVDIRLGLDYAAHGPYECQGVHAGQYPEYVNTRGWKIRRQGKKWFIIKPSSKPNCRHGIPVLQLEHDWPVPPVGRPFEYTAHTEFHVCRGVNKLSENDRTLTVCVLHFCILPLLSSFVSLWKVLHEDDWEWACVFGYGRCTGCKYKVAAD